MPGTIDANIYNEVGSGGALAGGNAVLADVDSSGGALAGGNAVLADVDSSGGVLAGGNSNYNSSTNQIASGGTVVGGVAPNVQVFVFFPDGESILTSGDSTSNANFSIPLVIEWSTRAAISLSTEFLWNVGTLPYRWYRVQGCCSYLSANNESGLTGGCDLTGIETDDPVCNASNSKQLFIQNIAARTVADVCKKLNEDRVSWEICSIKVWSRPADLRLTTPSDQCNRLTEVPFSQIPECIPISLQTRTVTKIIARSFLLDTFKYYIGSGGMTTSGSATTSSSVPPTQAIHEFSSDGMEVLVEGSAETSTTGNDVVSLTFVTNIIAKSIVPNVEAVFSIVGTGNSLVLPARTVNTPCGSCDAMPVVIYAFHNIGYDSVFSNFLQRNGLQMQNPLAMHYNTKTKSWISSYHLVGIGDDNVSGSQESWNFNFDWSCSSIVAGDELGSSRWAFSMLVVRKNLLTGLMHNTRYYIVFPPEQICNSSQNLGFDFSFSVNTSTLAISTGFNVGADVNLLVDKIGLFRSAYWTQNPNFSIRLSKNITKQVSQRQTISIV